MKTMPNALTSAAATEMLRRQLLTWPLAAKNFAALDQVCLKTFAFDGFTIKVQFNPARIVSSGAKVDARSIQARKCFLCPANLPAEQMSLPFGDRYQVLTNPFPIFAEHFTVPSLAHTPQLILPQLADFLRLTCCFDQHTLFYNGPRCGASAPDHAHFQAVSYGVMPLDEEVCRVAQDADAHRITTPEGTIVLLRDYLRNGFILQADTAEGMERLFKQLYALLPIPEGEQEPMMNLFGWYRDDAWTLAVIPRKRHRPWQYEAEGADHLLSSPGAADIGGLFITPLAEDFEKINPALLQDVFQQVCLSDEEVTRLFDELLTLNNK